MSLPQELDHLKIPLKDIKAATNNFSYHNFLGQGGFGRVYRGELSLSATRSRESVTTIAVKRLDVKGGQGAHEFSMEIVMLSSYKHDNLVSLIGFADEGDEKLLVYKLEDNGSLDKYLTSTNLTWEQRLRICIGAARGLEYLHCGDGGHRIIHRDIKSSNILLDANWEAKISDFGLSKFGPTNQQFTFLVTTAAGTFGYVDPLYVKTGVLTKESDVYSFGVVLFEVLCGRPAMIAEYEDQRRFLSRLVELGHKKGKMNKIVMPFLLEHMKPHSLKLFSDIAMQCLNDDKKQRPTIGLIVQELETVLQYQTETRIIRPQIVFRYGSLKGGKGEGSRWSFQLESNQTLRKITIYHDRWIHSLIFTTENSYGSLQSSQQFGGLRNPNKGRMDEVIFDDGEEVTHIIGSQEEVYDNLRIQSLQLFTKFGSYGVFGKKKSAYPPNETSGFDMRTSGKGTFSGFHGHSGMYLNGLGFILKNND